MKLTDSKDLAITLEQAILEKLNEENLKSLRMIVFGFKRNDYATINVWFLDEWKNFPYADDGEEVLQITDDGFSKAVDHIGTTSVPALFKDKIQLRFFFDRLRFSEESQDKHYNSLENHWRLVLLDAVQIICRRQKLPKFENLVELLVCYLHCDQHPELVSLYSPHGDKELLPIRLEDENIREGSSCWCKFTEEGLHLFCSDVHELDSFQEIFGKEADSYFIKYNDVKHFGLEKDGQFLILHILLSNNKKFKVFEGDSSKAEGVLVPSNHIEDIILLFFQKHCDGKEISLGRMPNPHDNELFTAWVENQKTLSVKFGWRDLERAVDEFGAIAALKFLPTMDAEDSGLYSVLHHVGIPLLINEGYYKEAYHSYQCLNEETQERSCHWHIILLVSLGKAQELENVIAKIGSEDEVEDWLACYLSEIESLFLWRKGNTKKAISILKSIPKDTTNSDYLWYEACIYSQDNPEYALQQFKLAMNTKKPTLPTNDDYRFHKEITNIQEQKLSAIAHAKNMTERIEQTYTLVEPNITQLDIWQTVRKGLIGGAPQNWEELAEVTPQTGPSRHLFTYKEKKYQLSNIDFSNGVELSEVNYLQGAIELGNPSIVCKDVLTVFQCKNLLLIATKEDGVLTVDLVTAEVLHQQSRYFSEEVRGIFANEKYLLLCSMAGVEFFVKEANNQWHFVNLLGAGEERLPYSWANEALIVDDILYVAAGNAGLLVFSLNDQQTPTYLTRLVFNGKQPYVEKIQHINNHLLLSVNHGIWVVNIADRKKPTSQIFFKATKESTLCLPVMITNDTWLIFDTEQPTIWEIDSRTLKQNSTQKVILARDLKTSLCYYYFRGAILFAEDQYLIASSHNLSLIQLKTCKALTTVTENLLSEKTETFFLAMQNALQEYAHQHDEKIGFLRIQPIESGLILEFFEPQALSGMRGYNQKALMTVNFEFEDFGIHINPDENWPYDILSEITVDLAKQTLITSLLKSLKSTKLCKKISAEKFYLLATYYNADIDGFVTHVESQLRADWDTHYNYYGCPSI